MDPLIEEPEDGQRPGENRPEFTVSELSGAVKRMVEGEFGHVRVRGELGRISRPRSGHVYLDLKDDRSVLAGVVWKGTAARLDIDPKEGDEVIATGRLTTFAGQSKYQIVIESLAYAGEGALLAKLERLKKALADEGLFAPERKRPLPFLPRAIGVVTSPTGAVIRDILHRLAERFPTEVLVWPVAVQGAASAGEVAAAIRGFNALDGSGPTRPDLLIVARGGGSVEDLWGFNEEPVVRAAAASTIPLISAVGHETDTTLIDLAADRRAPTPTAAAEMAVPVRAELGARVAELEARRRRALGLRFEQSRQRLRDLGRALPGPQTLIEGPRQRLDLAAARLPRPDRLTGPYRERLTALAPRLAPALAVQIDLPRRALSRLEGRFSPRLLTGPLERARAQVAALHRLLESLGYRQTLARGYAVVRGADGSVRTHAAAVRIGEALEIEFADARLPATAAVAGRKPAGRRGRPSAQPSLFDDE